MGVCNNWRKAIPILLIKAKNKASAKSSNPFIPQKGGAKRNSIKLKLSDQFIFQGLFNGVGLGTDL